MNYMYTFICFFILVVSNNKWVSHSTRHFWKINFKFKCDRSPFLYIYFAWLRRSLCKTKLVVTYPKANFDEEALLIKQLKPIFTLLIVWFDSLVFIVNTTTAAILFSSSFRSPSVSRIHAKVLYATSKVRFRRVLEGILYEIQPTGLLQLSMVHSEN